MTFHAQMESPLGQVLLCSDNGKLSGVYFMDQSDCPAVPGIRIRKPENGGPSTGTMNGMEIRKFKVYRAPPNDLFSQERAGERCFRPDEAAGARPAAPHLLEANVPAAVQALFRQTQAELNEYFAGGRTVFDIALDVSSGTDFQKKVWRALQDIPYGQTVSYGEVALSAGLTSRHGRPVGAAVGRNPITIIIPCHRVLSGINTLTGYTGGLERKFALLELEGLMLRQD